MELTQEQLAIINTTEDIRINAVAGSGKTTTVIAYAKAQPATSRILYLAFNKSVKIEAAQRFAQEGLTNVQVETAHSLAFKHIVYYSNYKVRAQGYKTNEIVEILSLRNTGEKHTEFVIANHVNKLMAYFCNSSVQKVQDLNYLDIVTDEAAYHFVQTNYNLIVSQCRQLLGKMNNASIEITHDFYLKKFQLANPVLPYDTILFDEAQDASPAMLAVFLYQSATKVMVGDTHQQIYGWRFAVNSLEKASFKTLHLSASFRFAKPIAQLAQIILGWKQHLQTAPATALPKVVITGKGNSQVEKTKAVIARTNLGLLLKAIEYVTEKKELDNIYFEGNIYSYTYAEEGASLYDVLNLQQNNHHLIKDSLIKAMKDVAELEEYIEKTEDMQLGMMVEIVKEYGVKIPNIIKQIKEKHVANDEKHKATLIFSTVHRCKGMEYDSVQLVNDFIWEEKLLKLTNELKNEPGQLAKLNEEINLLYVAVTRTRNILHIPENLLPKDFPPSLQIKIIPTTDAPKRKTAERATNNQPTTVIQEKAYTVAEVRTKSKDAYQPWTPTLDAELTELYCKNTNIKMLAQHFGRTAGAIYLRIKKLELLESYG